MRLYLIRHSIRADDGEPTANGDPDAELTPEGEELARTLARWMVDKDEIPTILIVSPTVRTQETAEAIADEIEQAGYVAPKLTTDVSIGPHMSIRGAVLNTAVDKSLVRVGLVSHHESIENGLRELRYKKNGKQRTVSPHLDQMAMGELRIMKVRRRNGSWDEHRRVRPSDLGLVDCY